MEFSPRNSVVSDMIAIRTEKRFTQSEEQSLFGLLLEMESRLRTPDPPPVRSSGEETG